MSLQDRVIVLDFDGVIWDSVDESFEQAWTAWTEGHGHIELDRTQARTYFREARWQCKDGHDFYIVMALLAQGRTDIGTLPTDAFRAARETLARTSEAEAFVKAFYASRERMRRDDFDAWCALQRPFAGMIAHLETMRREARGVAVATTKDAPSAQALLEAAGIHDLPVYGREVSLDKNDHLRAIMGRYNVAAPAVAFIEDLLENLHNVAPLGVRLVLADWGYNTPTDRARASAEGVEVVSLENLTERLRGLWADPSPTAATTDRSSSTPDPTTTGTSPQR